jgi:methionyl-tRNA synthetase
MAGYEAAMNALDLRGAAEAAWSLVSRANLYIVERAPWALAKAGDAEALDEVLASLVRALVRLAAMTVPFMPGKAAELWSQLGSPTALQQLAWKTAWTPAVGGWKVRKPDGLFPKPLPPAAARA